MYISCVNILIYNFCQINFKPNCRGFDTFILHISFHTVFALGRYCKFKLYFVLGNVEVKKKIVFYFFYFVEKIKLKKNKTHLSGSETHSFPVTADHWRTLHLHCLEHKNKIKIFYAMSSVENTRTQLLRKYNGMIRHV